MSAPYRNSYRRAITAISAASNATAVPLTWRAEAAAPSVVPVNPDLDVQTDLVAQTTITGIRNNRALYGDSAFLYRNQAYGAQNNPAGYLGYMASGNAEGALAAAIGVTFFAMDGVDTEDPSNIKRFVSTFDAEQGGGLFRVYVQQISSKLVAITVEFYEKIVITYSSGIRKLVISQ